MKVLVIVDVQKQFKKFIQHDLIGELEKYCECFDKVYQIWDSHNNVTAPSESFSNEIDCIPKKFGKNCFSPAVKKFITKIENSTEEGKVFSLKNDDGYIIRVDNNHDWFYINPEIVKLINEIKNDDITLVGGAEGECLEDVYQAFIAFDLKTNIDHKYTYSAKTKYKDNVKDTIGDWKESKFESVKKFNDFLIESNNDAESAEEICVIIHNYDELVKLNEIVKKYTNDNRILDKSDYFFKSNTIYIFIELEDYWVNVYTSELTVDMLKNDKEFDYVYGEIYDVKKDLDLLEKTLKNHITEPIEYTQYESVKNFNDFIINEKCKPSFFNKTCYREPTNSELEEINKCKLNSKEVIDGLTYSIVGRGMLNEKTKLTIISALSSLVKMFPENNEYAKALKNY